MLSYDIFKRVDLSVPCVKVIGKGKIGLESIEPVAISLIKK